MAAPTTRPNGAVRCLAAVLLAVVTGLALPACSSGGGGGSAGQPAPDAAVTTAPGPAADPGVEDLIVATGMTPSARKSFLATDPRIEDAATLAQTCAEVIDAAPGSSNSHTYGCVAEGKIHVRAFSRPEVRDLIYVSAAHELLHVVYAQLSRSERERLDAELDAARAANPLLEERLDVYKRAGEDTANEVHSLLGTEFANLSPALEAHYAKYFDRALVLAAFQRTLGQREEELRALQAHVDDLEQQLTALKDTMDAQEQAGNLRAFNANVARYNQLVEEHNGAVDLSNQKVDEYNHLTD